MGRLKMFDVIVFTMICTIGVYTGTQFFEPIVIDQLRKDGNLRKDIDIPEYDGEGNPVAPKSMLQLREELDKVLAQKEEGRNESKDVSPK